ncbi:transposase [Zobellia galactanivorans]|uniref:transposase n=1 Tax=Zobellia galactanivorans (strain DSM 12802 / CCUG 47099 / CIP 106680 / NCIMB 13871 / Dsij) TaxID=63186 RepID=UPI0026E40C37|nr:transposase [Zobellia galactanivorans]MDO6811308.1 transposase [Zobellia galactanivorans]
MELRFLYGLTEGYYGNSGQKSIDPVVFFKLCPLKSTCLGKVNEKQFSVTYYRAEYERNIKRVNSEQGRYIKGKRQSTVEPVFGTLTQFMGLRKVNTIGLEQANKVMHLSAIAYNLKKYLKFEQKRSKSGAGKATLSVLIKTGLHKLQRWFLPPVKTMVCSGV